MALIFWRQCVSVALMATLTGALFVYQFNLIPNGNTEPLHELKGADLVSALLVAALSTFFNVLIIAFHIMVPPHPKFLIVRHRYLTIRLHLISGILEITSSVGGLILGYCFKDRRIDDWVWVAGIAGLIHALTAVRQTGLVFGAKIIMRPSYYMISLMHGVAAVASVAYPASRVRLLQQYLILCIFTWCRVYQYMMLQVNVGVPALYTVGIAAAGLTIVPFVIGPFAILLNIFFIYLCAQLWRWSLGGVPVTHPEYVELTMELVRSQLFDVDQMSKWKGLPADASTKENKEAARAAFELLDADKSGLIERSEVLQVIDSLHVHPTVRRAVDRVLKQNAEKGGIDFDSFYRGVWNLGTSSKQQLSGDLTSCGPEALKAITDPTLKAMVVFSSIDLDGSGILEQYELAELLVAWGCPDDEAQEFLEKVDVNGDGSIEFKEFYDLMKPVWQFGFDVIVNKAKDEKDGGWSLKSAASKSTGEQNSTNKAAQVLAVMAANAQAALSPTKKETQLNNMV